MLSDGKFEYIYKTSTDRVPFAQVDISTKEVTYLHSDLTGSIVATTDSAGVLIGTVDYSPYGEVIGSSLSRFGYAGEWIDEVTGYVYLRARWMDVSTGSFLSEDSLVQMTNNAFGYTEGNPLSQIDPLGLFSWGGVYNGIMDNSSWISLGLLVVGTALTVTGVGAPLGLAIGIAGSALSLESSRRNFYKGEYEDAALDLLGVIPGLAIAKSFRSVEKLQKSVKLETNFDYRGQKGKKAKQNKQDGKIRDHNASLDTKINKNIAIINGMDLMDAGVTGASVGRTIDKLRKENNECK